MGRGKSPPAWGLGRRLMRKSLDLAFEDPEMAVRFARLSVRVSAILGEEFDPFAKRPRPKRGGRRKKGSP
jgi:hypothetical protein